MIRFKFHNSTPGQSLLQEYWSIQSVPSPGVLEYTVSSLSRSAGVVTLIYSEQYFSLSFSLNNSSLSVGNDEALSNVYLRAGLNTTTQISLALAVVLLCNWILSLFVGLKTTTKISLVLALCSLQLTPLLVMYLKTTT